MANQTGTATSQEDLLSQLFTFAAANGFTNEEFDTGDNRGTLSRTAGGAQLYVHFGWDGSEAGGPNNIAIAQSLGFAGPEVAIDAHTNDSGNGGNSGTDYSDGRRVDAIGNGPFPGYHFFADTSPSPYCYVVLQYATGLYRHFGFGILEKIGDWTGGEFAYGHVWTDGDLDNLVDNSHTLLLDGIHGNQTGLRERAPATLHAEGLPDEFGSPQRWLNVGRTTSSGWRGTDGDGQERGTCLGGGRGGYWNHMFALAIPSLINGFTPLIPIPAIYRNETPPLPEDMLLGFMPNIRHVNMKNFNPAQEVTVGSDTWVIFPGTRKRFEQDNAEESGNMGIAYLKTS